jgi:two-component system phosphate regulon sensor histidine kinase PhoR
MALQSNQRNQFSATEHRPVVERGADPREEFASGTLLEATMNGMREGLLVVDRDLRVVASNSAAQKLFTLADGKPNKKRLTELTRNPAIYDAFLDALKGKARSGVKVEIHEPVRRIFDLRVVPLADDNGHDTEGAIGVFFDISRLERLERVRQEFLSNVSHELRTPLTAIVAFVETLETGTLEENDNNRRFLAIIRKNAARMHTLIDDILELSAIEAGNVKVEPSDIELYPLVNDVVTSLAAKASAEEIVINNQIDPAAVIYADPSRLEQMLINLLENAIKFNRKQGEVTIRSESGAVNRIMVHDTGEGIPAQHLERLFERFYRVDRARSRELGGTGLGLAIVKHLARAHGGEVRVESKLGEGSTFWIDLPASQSNNG